jgi:hypothetical protein
MFGKGGRRRRGERLLRVLLVGHSASSVGGEGERSAMLSDGMGGSFDGKKRTHIEGSRLVKEGGESAGGGSYGGDEGDQVREAGAEACCCFER